MANINLLPWRDELRAEKKKQFYTVLGLVAALGAVVVFGWLTTINGQIEAQKVRNNLLEREIAQLDKKVDEIKELKKEREQLIERMTVIQKLQGNRPQIVRVFDDFVRRIPDGVYFEEMERKESEVRLMGVAESNNRVSSLMRLLDNSDWLDKPNLISVKKVEGSRGSRGVNDEGDEVIPNQFEMTIQITAPDAAAEEEDS